MMKEYLKVGLITFFVSSVLSGLLFTFSPERLNWLHLPFTVAIIYPTLIISIVLAAIVIFANRYLKVKNFRVFTKGFLVGGLVLFILTYLLFPTIPFFGLLFIDLLYLPGLLIAHGVEKLILLITPLPTATSDNPFFVWPTIMISIIFYTLTGAFLNIWRYKRSEQNQEINVQLKGY